MNYQATAPDGSSVLSQRFPGRTKQCCASRPHMMQLLISPASVPTEQGPGATENPPARAHTYLSTPLSDKSKVQTLVFLHKLCDETSSRTVSQSVGKSYVAIEKIWSPTQSYKASNALISRTLHASVLSNHRSTFFLPHGIVIHSKQCETFFSFLCLAKNSNTGY